MKNNFFFSILFICFGIFLCGQNDTLITRINSMKDDTNKFRFIYKRAIKLTKSDLNKAKILADLAGKLITKLSDFKSGTVAQYHLIGEIFYIDGKTDSALHYFTLSLNLALKIHDDVSAAKRYSNVARIYKEKGKSGLAMDYFMKALKINERIRNKVGESYVHFAIGNMFREQKNYDKALEHFEKAMKLSEEEKDKRGMASGYINIGVVYSHKKMDKEELDYYNKALVLQRELGDSAGVADMYDRLSQVYYSKNEKDKSLEYSLKALKLHESLGNKEGLAIVCVNLGNTYLVMNKNAEAKKMYEKSLAIALQIGRVDLILYDYNEMSKLYMTAGNYKLAYEYHVKYSQMNDSLLSSQSTKQVAEMEAQYENEKKVLEIRNLKNEQELKNSELEKKKQEIKRQNTQLIAIGSGLALMVALSLVIYRNYRQKKKANLLIQKQKQLVEHARDQLEIQKAVIEEKNTEILDSIHYAKRIQRTLLAQKELMDQYLGREYFTFFQPKDIVSGDFYWATAVGGNKFFLAVCDSTGHGVPGAFMCLLNVSFLNEAINEKNIHLPNNVLDHVRKRLIENISADGGKDGMDGILLLMEKKNSEMKISYAAAHNAPVFIRDNDLKELEADKMPVGIGERKDNFKLFTPELKKKDMVYLFTDGFADQFGGPKGKKFRYKQLNETLVKIHNLECNEQRETLSKTFYDWKGNLEQVDDVCIIGIRLSV